MKEILLNEKQQEAVNYFEGPLRIIAGAGTGKTRVIVAKINKLLKLDVCSNKICAITFTNKAVNEIRTRVMEQNLNSEKINISTYHSLCNLILKNDIDKLPNFNYKNDFEIINDSDKNQIIKNSLKEIDSNMLNSNNIKSEIRIISNYISTKKVQIKNKENNDNLLYNDIYNEYEKYNDIYNEYEKYLAKNQLVDYDSLLQLTYKLFKENQDILTKWKNKFEYILVDEFQDSNDIQFEIIKFLASDKLIVVGDPDQNIYSWRGANQNLILNFKKYFPNLKTIILDTNYRSNNGILNFANNLIEYNYKKNKLSSKILTPPSGTIDTSYKPLLTRNESYKDEISDACKKIQNLIKNEKYKYSDITILYRNSYQSREIEKQLRSNDINYKIIGNFSFFQRAEVVQLLKILKFVLKKDDHSLINILNIFRGIGSKSIENLDQISKEYGKSYLEVINNYLDKLKTAPATKFLNLKKILDEYKNINSYKTIFLLATSLIESFKLNEYFKNDKDRIDNIKELLLDIKNFENNIKNDNQTETLLFQYLENITLDTSDNLNDNINDPVTIMTIHQSKGIENKVIFIVALCDGILPSSRHENLDEERRVLYVAITRAEEKLFLSYNTDYNFFISDSSTVSSFLSDIDKKLYERKSNIINNNVNNYSNFHSSKKNDYFFGPNPKYTDKTDKMKISSKYKIDDIVKHPIFGEGKVIKIINENLLEIKYIDSSFGNRDTNSSILELIKK